MHFGPCKQCTRTALLQAGLCVNGIIHLKTMSLNEGKCSLPLLRPPASTQAGVPHDCLFVESRIKVKDDIWAFDEVNLEPAREKGEGETTLHNQIQSILFAIYSSQNAATVHDTQGETLERLNLRGHHSAHTLILRLISNIYRTKDWAWHLRKQVTVPVPTGNRLPDYRN